VGWKALATAPAAESKGGGGISIKDEQILFSPLDKFEIIEPNTRKFNKLL